MARSRNADYNVQLHFESDLENTITAAESNPEPYICTASTAYPPSPCNSPPPRACPPDVHTAPMYSKSSKVVTHDEHTSVMCGCSNHFFWECIPSNNVISIEELDQTLLTAACLVFMFIEHSVKLSGMGTLSALNMLR